MSHLNFHFHPDVQTALAEKKPVVALESTLITHGLPYPENLTTAQQMETAVRHSGAQPATIAILRGQIHIGLNEDQLTALATTNTQVRKCSRRDIPLAVAQQEDGATTVAGTMFLAHRAGIAVFATGGIGGVHRGHPFDVSADLTELGRTPVAVVCSGAKAILDLPATREVLETQGVPVIGYGTDAFPAFFATSSGLPVDTRVDSPAAAAAIIQAHQALGQQNGLLFTVPVPADRALPQAVIETAIQQATREADAAGIHGAAATPWLLERVKTLSDGQTMTANIALLINNAAVAGQIAVALLNS